MKSAGKIDFRASRDQKEKPNENKPILIWETLIEAKTDKGVYRIDEGEYETFFTSGDGLVGNRLFFNDKMVECAKSTKDLQRLAEMHYLGEVEESVVGLIKKTKKTIAE